jgi:hypothetical protein
MVASLARWSVGIGSALVEFHPAPQRRLDADGRIDPLQVAVLDVLLDLGTQLDESLLLGRALARRLGLRTNAGDDLARLLQDRVAVEVVEVPARCARLLRELACFLVESRERIAEETCTPWDLRPLKMARKVSVPANRIACRAPEARGACPTVLCPYAG